MREALPRPENIKWLLDASKQVITELGKQEHLDSDTFRWLCNAVGQVERDLSRAAEQSPLGPALELQNVVTAACVWRNEDRPMTRFELRKAVDKYIAAKQPSGYIEGMAQGTGANNLAVSPDQQACPECKGTKDSPMPLSGAASRCINKFHRADSQETNAPKYRLFKRILCVHPEARLSWEEFEKQIMPLVRLAAPVPAEQAGTPFDSEKWLRERYPRMNYNCGKDAYAAGLAASGAQPPSHMPVLLTVAASGATTKTARCRCSVSEASRAKSVNRFL